MGRVYMLDFVSGVIFTLVFTTDKDNKILKKIIIIIVIVLATVFFAYGVSKFYYRLNEMSLKQILDDTISVYVAGPLVGMQILLKNGVPTQEPKATLSFFYRLFNAFGANMHEYIRIDKLMLGPTSSLNGNVFTVFYYLIIDYGYIAAFTIFCVFGAIHGLLYKAALNKEDGFFILILTFMYYPLLMQFFDEQYITQISKFIQIVFWSFILFKTPLVFRKDTKANQN
jgi:oligosaccharide repeat unit polymerase